MRTFLLLCMSLIIVVTLCSCNDSQRAGSEGLLPIPDKLIVLAFDDWSSTWASYVAPLLKNYGFGATFFVTEAGWIRDNYGDDELWLSWDDARKLHDMGFEIGNHTATHPEVPSLSKEEFAAELELIEKLCVQHGISKPTSFGYPGGWHNRDAVEVLAERGYLFARRNRYPEYPMDVYGVTGLAYEPGEDHPLIIPGGMTWGVNSKFEDFVKATGFAKDGKIAAFTFHGVPDPHPHCSTKRADFERMTKYLYDNGYTVIALRDLAKYVDPYNRPDDPYEPIRRRMERMKASMTAEE